VRAELHRVDDPEKLVAVATWSHGRATLEVIDPSLQGLDAVLRPTPVVVDDPSLRRPGTRGESLLEPGSFGWFRAALVQRADGLGLRVRFVAPEIVGGWDPAASYRSFDEEVERLASS
jgi:hypothetical protein